MSLSLAIISSLIGVGYLLNKEGKQSREEENVRMQIDKDEQPSGKNIYHSERYYDAFDDEFERATKAHLKAQDPVNENVVPLYYNDLGARSEMSPEMKSYMEKRGNRLKGWESDLTQQKSYRTAAGTPKPFENSHKKFINEVGNKEEVQIAESPMFNPLGYETGTREGFSGAPNDENEKQRQSEMLEQFSVTNRSSDPRTNGVSKQEHFQSYTIHGPANSNNPNFHNNMVPFFGSRVTQNMDPMANQTTLEYYTGQTNEVTEFRSRPKREIPSLQDRTPGQTYIYGTPVDNAYQKDRYITSTLKTSITPFQQIRVGKGISGTYDWKPRDGFNDWYQPAFKNVDELRVNPKNVYEGRLLPGKEVVESRGVVGDVYKRRPDRFWVNDQRRYFKTTGSFTGPKIRENFLAYKQNREDTNIAYTGIAGNKENLSQNTGVYIEGSDMDINSGASVTYDRCTGEPIKQCFNTLNARVQHTDKNQLAHTPFRNFGAGQTDKNIKVFDDTAKTTLKETTLLQNYTGQAAGDTKQTQYFNDDAKTTTRQTVEIRDRNGQVFAGSLTKNTKAYDDEMRTTLRQTNNVEWYQGQIGTASTNKSQKYLDDEARTTTRQSLSIIDYLGSFFSGQTAKNQQYLQDEARATTRQSTNIREYQGIAGNQGNLKQQKYLDDKARENIRNSVNIINYEGIAGSGQTQTSTSYEAMYNAESRNNAESLLESRTNGPNNKSSIVNGACSVNIQIKDRAGYDVTRYGPLENKQYQITPSLPQSQSHTTSRNQRDQTNPYQPQDFVVEQHCRNPYTQSLTSATQLTSTFKRGETPFGNCPPNTLTDKCEYKNLTN